MKGRLFDLHGLILMVVNDKYMFKAIRIYV